MQRDIAEVEAENNALREKLAVVVEALEYYAERGERSLKQATTIDWGVAKKALAKAKGD